MARKVKIYWDDKEKKPKKDKDDPAVNILPDGTVELTSRGIKTVLNVETWNHGAGWNSITLEFDE